MRTNSEVDLGADLRTDSGADTEELVPSTGGLGFEKEDLRVVVRTDSLDTQPQALECHLHRAVAVPCPA